MKKEKKEYLKGIFRAEHKNARVSPKKARDVARAIQGMRVDEAVNALTFTPRKSARLIKKTLDSALANAVSINDEMDEVNVDIESLIVKEAVVNDARTLRRFKPRARGSAGPIRKRQSHISIVIAEDNPANKEEK